MQLLDRSEEEGGSGEAAGFGARWEGFPPHKYILHKLFKYDIKKYEENWNYREWERNKIPVFDNNEFTRCCF
jgi:hypothetical protein